MDKSKSSFAGLANGMKLTPHTRIPRVDYPVSWPNGNSFLRLKRCWLCSVNLPRIGKQVQFTINASIPRQTAEIAPDSRSCMHISLLQRSALLLLRAPRSILSLSRVWVLFEGCGNYSRGRSREEMGTACERSRREIWPAAVPQNFRVICAKFGANGAYSCETWEKAMRRSVRAKRSNVEAEQIRKGG